MLALPSVYWFQAPPNQIEGVIRNFTNKKNPSVQYSPARWRGEPGLSQTARSVGKATAIFLV